MFSYIHGDSFVFWVVDQPSCKGTWRSSVGQYDTVFGTSTPGQEQISGEATLQVGNTGQNHLQHKYTGRIHSTNEIIIAIVVSTYFGGSKINQQINHEMARTLQRKQ